jgi:signal transduction histidine kinase/CheY-like chemotaxis protein
LQRHSSALALSGLAIAGLTLGAVLAFDVNPSIEATHDSIVATRRLEQHDTALGLALLRVHHGPSAEQSGADDALAAAARAVEKESERLLDRQSPAAGADTVALAAARQAAGQIRRQLESLEDSKSALATSRGSIALLSGWAGDLAGGATTTATVDDQVRQRATALLLAMARLTAEGGPETARAVAEARTALAAIAPTASETVRGIAQKILTESDVATRTRAQAESVVAAVSGVEAGTSLEALIAAHGAELVRLERRRRQIEVSLGLTALLSVVVSLRVLRVQRRARQSLEHWVLERTRDLADANVTLTRASRTKTEFLANTSHEIRTPLAAILGFADLLDRERLETNDRREIARIIRRNGEHLLAIVNDILDITKIEAGKLTVEAIACSPQQIAQEVCALLRNRAQSKGLALSLQIEGSELPRWIESDPTRIRQILLNLIGNAIKFTERGGVTVALSLDARGSEPRLRVEVRDTGIGMTPEEAARVFADFEQADSSTTRRFGGSGLGLAICRRLTTVLGGELSVQSVRGQGSTFALMLPVARAVDPVDDLRETAVIAPRGIPPRSGLHVLVADDSADIQMLVTRFLADIAAAATVVSNGREAVEAALAALHQGRPFDLILMDLHMPELDGAEAARTLRNAGLEQPIVALTASDDIGDRERCAAAGYSDFLVKPIDRVQLIQKIATLNGVDPGEPRRSPAPPSASVPVMALPVSAAATPAFDAERLLATVGGDPSVRDALLALFQGDAPALVQSIQTAASSGDGDALRAGAHKLKGMLLTVRAAPAADVAAALESAARAGDEARLEALVAELEVQVARICASMGGDAPRV